MSNPQSAIAFDRGSIVTDRLWFQLRELEGLQSLLDGQEGADGAGSMGLQFGEVPEGAPAAELGGRLAGANAAAVAQLRDDGMQRLEDMLVAEGTCHT